MRFIPAVFVALVSAGLAVSTPVEAATSGFSDHKTDDPIRFSANKLEVKKEGRVATFSGDVEAIQGDLTLLAQEIRVYYSDSSDGDKDDKGGLGGSVSRIDTKGKVHISSRGDTATGDWAVYDVERRIVTVGGKVVLQQGETVIRGNRLELDLDSGQSRFRGQPSGTTDQRVTGELTPATSDKKKE
ncbi:MAG: hypothetical protein O2910_04040 [Proteobacteria bacterium]|nr:hypothetical protein [Pseudomonadota bacterium]